MSPSPEISKDVLETGLSEQDREAGVEDRDTVRELQEDLATHHMLIAYTRERLRIVQEAMKKASPDLRKAVESAQKGLADFEQRFSQIGTQAELFVAEPAGGSVKLEQFKKLRDEFRSWWNMGVGMENILAKVTHEFEQVEDLGKSIFAEDPAEKKQHYGRGFSTEVHAREQELAKEMTVTEGGDVALFNSGMSAIETILETEGLKKGDVIVAAENFYVHTGFLLDDYQKRGIKVIRVPGNDAEAFQKAIEEHDPKLVLAEVISNAPKMEVAPIEEMFSAVIQRNKTRKQEKPRSKKKTRLVLDNTFLTPQLLHLPDMAEDTPDSEHLPLAVVESATKYYQQGLDNVTAGLVYSDDKEYMEALKKKRVMMGTHMQEQLARYIPPSDAQALTEKIMRHSSNALLLAERLKDVEHVKVSHPKVEGHPDKTRIEGLAMGAGGLFYIDWEHPSISAEDAVNRIKQLADKEGVDVRIGVSFGHPQTWVETLRMPGEPKDAPRNIRISVGEENIADFKKVMDVFEKALSE